MNAGKSKKSLAEKLTAAKPYLITAAFSAIILVNTATPVLAATADPSNAMGSILKIVANIGAIISYVMAAILLISGIIKYASAHSDGNGPEEKQAIKTLASAVVLIAVGTALLSINFDSLLKALNFDFDINM